MTVGPDEIFGCIKDFTTLEARRNGRRKPEGDKVIIGDQPDVRVANLLFLTSVVHNWPSQGHKRYRRGYIIFKDGRIFDLADKTVDGKPAYIFPLNNVTGYFGADKLRTTGFAIGRSGLATKM